MRKCMECEHFLPHVRPIFSKDEAVVECRKYGMVCDITSADHARRLVCVEEPDDDMSLKEAIFKLCGIREEIVHKKNVRNGKAVTENVKALTLAISVLEKEAASFSNSQTDSAPWRAK